MSHRSARNVTVLIFSLLITTFFTSYADVLIAPDDPGINYYGRFDFSDARKPRYNWSGAVIEANVPGPLIGMRSTVLPMQGVLSPHW